MESPAPAASAPPAADSSPAVETLTAVEHAATTGNMREFRAARAAERADKPLPAVTVTEEGEPVVPAPADAAPAAPKLSRKERDQQDANERTRKAVELATADLRAQLDALKVPRTEATERVDAPPAAPPKETAVQMAKRFAALPDAPKLDQFDSVEEHAAAMALFINDKYGAERTAESQSRESDEAFQKAHEQRIAAFEGRLQDAVKADPEFSQKLTPEVRTLKPISGLAPGEPSGPLNILWEQVYDSPVLEKLLLHFSQHPEDLRRIETLPPEVAALPGRMRINAHITWILKEFGKIEGRLATAATAPVPSTTKTVSEAPTVDTLGGHAAEAPADAVMSAAVKGDFKQFRAAKRARLAAQRS